MVEVLAFDRAPAQLEQSGLVGWARVRVRGVTIDSFVVRRTRAGDMRAFTPERLDGRGRRIRVVEFENANDRREVEGQILAALRERGDVR